MLGVSDREAGRRRELVDGRPAAQFIVERALGPQHTAAALLNVDRQPDRLCLVADGAVDRLTDPPHGVRGQLVPPPPVKALDGADQAERALLDQVEQRDTAVSMAASDRDDEAEIRLDHPMLRRGVAMLDPLASATSSAAVRRRWRRISRRYCASESEPGAAPLSPELLSVMARSYWRLRGTHQPIGELAAPSALRPSPHPLRARGEAVGAEVLQLGGVVSVEHFGGDQATGARRASAASSRPAGVWRTSTSGELTTVRTTPGGTLKATRTAGDAAIGRDVQRCAERRGTDPGREDDGAGRDGARRRVDPDDGVIPDAQPAHRLGETHLRAVASGLVDERLGHGDGVDGPVGRPQERTPRRRPQIRLQPRDLLGVDEPLIGSGAGAVRRGLPPPRQRPRPAHRDRRHAAIEPRPVIRRGLSQWCAGIRRLGRPPPIQANESPVTPEAGRDRSTSTTAAPRRAA